MATEGDARHHSLLTLQGEIVVHYMDGTTLEGEFAAQDEFNIFVNVAGEPVMIPRHVIKFIKGKQARSIEPDVSVSKKSGDTLDPVAAPSETQPLDDTDEASDEKTVAPEEITESPDTEEIPEKALETQDTGPIFDDDEDPTLILEEEEAKEEEEEATFVLPELDLEPDTQEIAAYLDCITGPHSGEVFKLTTGMTTIGRASDNVLSLSKDKETSRKHSKISYESDGFIVEDLGSLNGTFINDERINTPHYLEDGDVILIGVSTLVYHTK